MMSRLQRHLLLGCMVLAACWGAVYLLQSVRQVDVWKTQVRAVAGPASNPQQARAALARVQGAANEWQVRQQQIVALEQGLSAWLQQQPGWSVTSMAFDGKHWRPACAAMAPGRSRPNGRPLPNSRVPNGWMKHRALAGNCT